MANFIVCMRCGLERVPKIWGGDLVCSICREAEKSLDNSSQSAIECDEHGKRLFQMMRSNGSVYTEVKDSGKRESFGTGAVRDTEEGKPRLDLLLKYIPMPCLMRITQHYVNGAKKYGDHNWQKGIPASRCISSALRHAWQYLIGDFSEDHLSAVVFNIVCIIYWEETRNLKMQDVHRTPVRREEMGLCGGRGRHEVDMTLCPPLANKETSLKDGENWYRCPVCGTYSHRKWSNDRWEVRNQCPSK